jgi:hypothetical protein
MVFTNVFFIVLYLFILSGNVYFAFFGKTIVQRMFNGAVAIFMIVVMYNGISSYA